MTYDNLPLKLMGKTSWIRIKNTNISACPTHVSLYITSCYTKFSGTYKVTQLTIMYWGYPKRPKCALSCMLCSIINSTFVELPVPATETVPRPLSVPHVHGGRLKRCCLRAVVCERHTATPRTRLRRLRPVHAQRQLTDDVTLLATLRLSLGHH